VPFELSEAILPIASFAETFAAGSNLNKQITSSLLGLYLKSTKSKYCEIFTPLL